MKAASREAQSHVTGKLEELIRNADNSVAVAAQIGTEPVSYTHLTLPTKA